MEEDQQFLLKCKTHQTTLFQSMKELRDSCRFFDCTLEAEGQSIKAHKLILSACSSYFNNLLKEYDDKMTLLTFQNLTFTELKAMINFMYTGEVDISKDRLDIFLKVANAFQIKGFCENRKSSFSPQNQNSNSYALEVQNSYKPPESDQCSETPSSANEVPEDSTYFSMSEDICSSEASQSPNKSKTAEDSCELIDLTEQEQLVSAMEVTNFVNETSHNFVRNIQPNASFNNSGNHADQSRNQVQYNLYKNVSSAASEGENSMRSGLEEKVPGSDFREETQEQLVPRFEADLENTNNDLSDYLISSELVQQLTELDDETLQQIIENPISTENITQSKSPFFEIPEENRKDLNYCPKGATNSQFQNAAVRKGRKRKWSPRFNYQCNICQKKMKYSCNVASHLKTHNIEFVKQSVDSGALYSKIV